MLEARHGAETAIGDVVENLPAGGHLVAFALERKRQRNADGVADAARDELFERDARLDHAIRRHARLGDAEVQRNVGANFGESDIRVDDLVRIGILQRYAILIESEIIEHDAMFGGRFDHRRDRIILRIAIELRRIDRSAIDSDAHRAAMFARDLHQVLHLFANRFVALDVMQVARVVPQLLHEWRDLFR